MTDSRPTPAAGDRAPAAQEQLLPFLLNPRSYPHQPRTVRLIQTHASFVFIAAPFVYKIKKPVNFGFLDFSTLEKRRYYCEREVELNRRLCPDAYLGVVPIGLDRGSFTFDPPPGAQVVEYAVHMRKLSERYFLDHLLARKAVGPPELDRIAHRLEEFYRAQHPTPDIEAWGQIDKLRISTDENFRQTEPFLGQTLSRPAYDAIRLFTEEFYSKRSDLFASRIRDRWIRDCHGDLHLEHIHLTPRSLDIYDCIEFNDRLRYVDVASDAAFLAMDLDYERRPDLARHFTKTMADVLRDEGMPRIMDFYKCYRAYVRGKVESLHSVAAAAPEAERRASAERARRYFRLSLQYATLGSTPLAVITMGRIASGKSTLACLLAVELDWTHYSSDRLRKELAGLPLYERGSYDVRQRLYSPAMTKATYAKLFQAATTELKAGRGVLLDATFARRSHRDALVQALQKIGAPFLALEAQASDDAVRTRLRERDTPCGEISDARLEDFQRLNRHYEPPLEWDATRCVPVPTEASLAETLTKVLTTLARRRAVA